MPLDIESGFGYSLSSAAGGGGTPSYVGVSDDAIEVGSILTFSTSGQNPGRLVKALADHSLYDAFGVANNMASPGQNVSVNTDGTAGVRFSQAPPASANGSTVYLSPTEPGRATLATPAQGGQAVVKIGRLVGADGVTVVPQVVIEIDVVALIAA